MAYILLIKERKEGAKWHVVTKASSSGFLLLHVSACHEYDVYDVKITTGNYKTIYTPEDIERFVYTHRGNARKNPFT